MGTNIVWKSSYHDLHIGNDYKHFNDADYSGNSIEIPFSAKLIDNVTYTGPKLKLEMRGLFGSNNHHASLYEYLESSNQWGLSSALEDKSISSSPIELAFTNIIFKHNINRYFVLKIEMASVDPTSGSQQNPPFAEIAVERISLVSSGPVANPFAVLLGFANVT